MTQFWPEGQAIEVWGGRETPGGFKWNGASHRVLDICNRWRIHSRWWEPDHAIWREYLKVVTDTGFLCLIYRDLTSRGWFLSRIYD